jgi:hypothetical protein
MGFTTSRRHMEVRAAVGQQLIPPLEEHLLLIPESSRSDGKKKSKKLGNMSEWIKAIFATCTYAANIA